ncbi:MAG: HD domain-containing protein [Desulfobacterales bacterium]|nr:HD domain-containing protein [Desulfobacterales bacterium]
MLQKLSINPVDILCEYYDRDSKTFEILLKHGEHVAQKALDAAEKVSHLNPDLKFIEEAALLHDIGIFKTNSPQLGCFGTHPYVCHGFLGREILEKAGLPEHALVCDRHMGTGISAEEIAKSGLPIPARDMIPVSIEEQVICYADKFFSKDGKLIVKINPEKEILRTLESYGNGSAEKFRSWMIIFQ